MKDPAGVIDLSELDELASLSGAGDVQPDSLTPVTATILLTVISIEATVSAFSYTIEC